MAAISTESAKIDLGRNARSGYTRVWTPAIHLGNPIGFSRLVTSRGQANPNNDEFTAVRHRRL